MASKDPKIKEKIMMETVKLASKHKWTTPPPYLGKGVQDLVKKISKNPDPYMKLKKKFNAIALEAYPQLKAEVGKSRDRLLSALKVAITGNVIDFGSAWKFNVHTEIEQLFQNRPGVFDYAEFRRAFKKARLILYIADNAGETVFDRVLIETMKDIKDVEVIYAVKESPILNDTMIEDALYAGLDKCSTIISSGSGLPGVMPREASKEFLRYYKSADIIIAKGMGNFELMDTEKGPIFFMLKAKCPVVAKELGVKMGDMVLRSGLNLRARDRKLKTKRGV
jgi:uncharacterized protein with ATP-grasp and redox domains